MGKIISLCFCVGLRFLMGGKELTRSALLIFFLIIAVEVFVKYQMHKPVSRPNGQKLLMDSVGITSKTFLGNIKITKEQNKLSSHLVI